MRERQESVQALPGVPYPLGATWNGDSTNFALFSENAEAVTLCLFDDDGNERQIELDEVTAHVWHGEVLGVGPGQRYGYRVHGDYDPLSGKRFNPAKLLIDPYAKAISGEVDWEAPVFGYPLGSDEEDLERDERDDAWGVPKGVVIDPAFDWGDDAPPRTPLNQSIIYEVHVKGFTKRHPEVPKELRGTYAGLVSEPALEHLRKLGVTAVELLPVHAFLDDKHLLDRGLRNYWGYNSINFFAPEARYASAGDRGEQVREFKEMVKALHAAGIEVILDVVYNHTAEGNHLGPTFSFRGIDNEVYYRLVPDEPRYSMDYTGTGNTINVPHPQVLQLVMDSLRYWVLEMHVDGFRFDLAAALARELHEVDKLGSFFDVIHQDPVLSQVKLIAEPWDVGEGGYQVGNFPVLWAEWNGKYRDAVREYWHNRQVGVAELAHRLTGSSDLYQYDGRRPYASINFITAHDGFTLHDLVSYDEKHNEDNGEENQDGHDDNISWNHGVEGPTDDPEIVAARERTKRSFLATLLLSQGVPMLSHGDEIGRTQQGNNNAYCQDNELSWMDWDLSEEQRALLDFTRKLVWLRREHPNFRRPKFFQARPIRHAEEHDIRWLRPDGEEMTDEEWAQDWVRVVGLWLSGETLPEVDARGEPVRDDTFLLLFNSHEGTVPFVLPNGADASWQLIVDTTTGEWHESGPVLPAGEAYELGERSLSLFRRCSAPPAPRRRKRRSGKRG
ncbi:MAG TPA: glycogen debranching protein GlgX [Thermomicrobiales bacterium]